MRAMTEHLPGLRFLHSPGPTHLPDAVIAAMARQPMDLADPRVAATLAACEAGVRRLAGTAAAQPIFFIANGHGAWEAVVQNLLAPDALALVPGTGHFSESWARQTEALGRGVVRTPWTEGEPMDVDAVEAALRADLSGGRHRIAAVFMVHTDTASGTTHSIDAVRAAMDAAGHPALLVVDAVASLGAAPLAMDAQRIDVLVGASQKGLMLPPGVGFTLVNAAAMAVAAANPTPRFYWDWVLRVGEMPYQKFCGTPPLTLMAGMEAGLALLFAEGLEAVFARHRRLAGAVQAAVAAWADGGAVDFFCRVPAARSVSVTAISTAPGVDADAIRRTAREAFDVSIAGGLGPLAGRVFRIGHLGDLSAPMVLGALGGVQAALQQLRIPIGRDGVAAAVDYLALDSARATSGTRGEPR
ncbi:aminotransferase class V-fold PLP-dependent enzyme [Rubrivivax albus]|uniref:Aminotransferase class V-fold PLP-dependent enzyme n=2 Tax=Rubrivivax albus TaxID=2499835 RepID=A0A3S2U540_9BURK|nr:aminotransferase class V-fold PLP-dependent enzyme [Rubrivivax albus]